MNLPDTPIVDVSTTEHKGHDVEFWAEKATNRIVSVGSNSPSRYRGHQAILIIALLASAVGKVIVKSPAVAVLSPPKSNTHTPRSELVSL